jgi:hypothetical protein
MLIPASNGVAIEFPFSCSTELYIIKPLDAVVINYLKVAAVWLYWLKGESQIISVSAPPYSG